MAHAAEQGIDSSVLHNLFEKEKARHTVDFTVQYIGENFEVKYVLR